MELPFRLHMPDRRRVASFTLALAVEALLIILLLIFGPRVTPVPKVKPPATFTLIPPDDSASTEPDRAKKADNSPKPKSASAPPSTLPPDVAPPQKAPPPPLPLPGVLPIQLGGLDISRSRDQGTATMPATVRTASSLTARAEGRAGCRYTAPNGIASRATQS